MRRIAVLDAPSNLGLRPPTVTSVPGCAKAPGALRDQGLLRRLNARDAGCLTPPRYDPGDWRPGDGVCHAPEIAVYSRRLADRIGAIIDQGEFPVVLGGDCSIVLGSALAMHRLGEAVGGRIGLVFVDGHSDFRHPGNASYVGAAAGEDLALVTGRGQANLAAMEGRRPYYRDIDVVVMGIRAQDEYRLDLQAAGIVTRPVPTLRAEGAARSAQWAREQLVDCAGYWVHLDVDVLDPAVMPAVDAPEPGGIAFPELELLLAGLVESPHCLGVEITVFDPDYDPDGTYAEEITAAIVSGLKSAHTVDVRPDLIAARADLVAPGAPGKLGPSPLFPGPPALVEAAALPTFQTPPALPDPPADHPALGDSPAVEALPDGPAAAGPAAHGSADAGPAAHGSAAAGPAAHGSAAAGPAAREPAAADPAAREPASAPVAILDDAPALALVTAEPEDAESDVIGHEPTDPSPSTAALDAVSPASWEPDLDGPSPDGDRGPTEDDPELTDVDPEPRDLHSEPRDQLPEPGDQLPELGDQLSEPGDQLPGRRDLVAEPSDFHPEPGDFDPEPSDLHAEPRDRRSEPGEVHAEPVVVEAEPVVVVDPELDVVDAELVEDDPGEARLRPLGSAPLLDSEPLPATMPGMLRPRNAEDFTLPAQRPAFELGPETPADIT
ncbi:arginase [Pseudosporangium ferrugineum]|uniref:Arginase n=1 Tax=Pseudosporangium ferrugineum TaxID=439699 RepID=A0A2T0SD44_9ACTN|nr:arginase family protein [Pseudosporangium ferrugineum]PRY31332.1 arginase [Pseudosporangium ferrugineum]